MPPTGVQRGEASPVLSKVPCQRGSLDDDLVQLGQRFLRGGANGVGCLKQDLAQLV